MNLDDFAKWLLGGLTLSVGALVTKVLGNWGAVKEARKEREALAARVDKLESEKLTQECVRKVVEDAFDKRDKVSDARRAEFDKLLGLQLQTAVREGVERCKSDTKRELESLIPVIVSKVEEAATRRFRRIRADDNDNA